MKVLEQGNPNEIADYINNIANCVETAKKLLVVLDKQQDNLKEGVFKYMVKEVRYELLELLENMVKKANIDSKKTKDDVERDVFMVCCETMTDELKTVGIREEWTLQQKHMGEVQNLILQANNQLSLHNGHYFTQGSVLIGILSKILEEDGTVEQLLNSTDLLEPLQTMGDTFYSIFSSHAKGCTGTSNNDCHKCALAICTTAAFISGSSNGEQFLLRSCPDVIQRFIMSLPLMNCRSTEKIKLVLLELFMNLAENTSSLACMKNFHCVFDYCLNQENQCKEVVEAALELLNKVINECEDGSGCIHFLNALRQCITVVTLQKHAEKHPNVKGIVESIAAKLESADSRISVKKEISSCDKLQTTKSEGISIQSNFSTTELPDRQSFYCSCASLLKNETDEETFTICASSSPKQSNTSINCKSVIQCSSKSCRQLSSEDECGASLVQNVNSGNDQLVSYHCKPNEVVSHPLHEYLCYGMQESGIAPKIISPNNMPPKVVIRSAASKITDNDFKVAQRLCARVKIMKHEEK